MDYTRILARCLVGLGAVGSALGADVSWTGGAGDSQWGTAANWSSGAVPAAGDAVTISGVSAPIVVAESTAALGSLDVVGSTLSVSGWNTCLNADTVTIGAGGIVTSDGPFVNDADVSRVWISCQDLTVLAGGAVDVTKKGYEGTVNGGYSADGRGPGKGQGRNRGAAHGGSNRPSLDDYSYGSLLAPETAGSSGGGSQGSVGGHGGGVIRIAAAGTVSVYGSMLADGGSVTGEQSAGAGGSVYITCGNFVGEGALIRAAGGAGKVFSSTPLNGAGGRIAIVTADGAENVLRESVIDASYGSLNTRFSELNKVDLGTVYLSDVSLFLAQNGEGFAGQLYLPGLDTWTLQGNYTVTRPMRFLNESMVISVGGNLTVSGEMTRFGVGGEKLFPDEPLPEVAEGEEEAEPEIVAAPWSVTVGGTLRVENNAKVWFYPPVLDRNSDFSETSDRFPRISADIISVGSGSAIAGARAFTNAFTSATDFYPYATRLLLNCRDLTVDAGGAIDASGLGFSGKNSGDLDGWSAPGYGPSQGVGRSYGAGHGGANNGSGGFYGCIEAPVTPGSGGGASRTNAGGDGGGIVRIAATGTVTVNGSVLANGKNSGAEVSAGAGGSVYITCARFLGANGVVQAKGGDGGNNVGDSLTALNGAGGRIAIVTPDGAENAVSGMVFDVAYGNTSRAFLPHNQADYGTLYFTDINLFLSQNGEGFGGQIYIPGFDSWTVNGDYVVTRPIRFTKEGFQLHVLGDLIVRGRLANLSMGGETVIPKNYKSSDGHLGGYYMRYESGFNPWNLQVDGDFRLEETSKAAFFPASALMLDETTAYGGFVTVGGALVLTPGTYLETRSVCTNGASVFYKANSVDIQAGATVTANDFGFAHVIGPGKGGRNHNIAGGYGGLGGGYTTNALGEVTAGGTYGDELRPWMPGSGGGFGFGYEDIQSRGGGGHVRIQSATSLVVNGTIDASTKETLGSWSRCASGSGGSILLECRSFEGAGTLKANASSVKTTYGSSAGGGGRISVCLGVLYDEQTMSRSFMEVLDEAPETFTGTAEALGGIMINPKKSETDPDPIQSGQDGTVRFVKVSIPYTLINLR